MGSGRAAGVAGKLFSSLSIFDIGGGGECRRNRGDVSFGALPRNWEAEPAKVGESREGIDEWCLGDRIGGLSLGKFSLKEWKCSSKLNLVSCVSSNLVSS